MRFMTMHKTNALAESGAPPCPEVMEGLGPLMAEMMQAGVFLSGEGLRPSVYGTRLRFRGGQHTATPGPFGGENELLASMCIVRVLTLEDAVAWATRWAAALGDVDIDVRPVTEPWDMGFCPPPPAGTPTRFMLTRRSDPNTEAGQQLTSQQRAAQQRLLNEMTQAGVLLALEELRPSSESTRLHLISKQRTVVDGPFTESKELIAGYAIVDVPTRHEAIAWSWRFAELVGDIEIDVRPLYEPSEL